MADLIDQLGGREKFAELSGRPEVANDKNYERDLFQRGQKNVAIITEASVIGVSFHADPTKEPDTSKPRRRLMIAIELPWAADKAAQTFGKVNRSNQILPPVFQVLVTDLGSEARFTSCVARRLGQLGAMMRGSRTSMSIGGDLQQFNIGSSSGQKALLHLAQDLQSLGADDDSSSDFIDAATTKTALAKHDFKLIESELKKANAVDKLLNRHLGVECELQNELWSAFTKRLKFAEELSSSSEGLLSLTWSRLQEVRLLESARFGEDAHQLEVRKLRVQKGIDWKHAEDLMKKFRNAAAGFIGCKGS